MIAPNTNIRLLKTEIEIDEVNTLDFVSESSKYNYFNSLPKLTLEDATYQRKEGVLRYPTTSNITFEDLLEYNYCMYQNESYDNKWFYAFIDDIRYINDGMCEIKLKTDTFMTWQNDIVYKESFIERQHVSDDTIGLHTIPENLETGEYIVDNKVQGRNFAQIGNVIIGATIELDDSTFPPISGTLSGGIYNGLKYFEFSSLNSLNNILNAVAREGKSDAIVSMFMGNSNFYDSEASQSNNMNIITPSYASKTATWSEGSIGGDPIVPPNKPTSLDTYVPTNKKLLTFPYCYLMASNNNGSNAIYKYELFSSNNCDFRYIGTLTPGMSIRLQPINYNNQEINNEEGLNLGKLPVCSWNTDVYTNWLTQNSVNVGLSVASGLLTMAGGFALSTTGAGALAGSGGIISGGLQIANSLGQVYQHSLTPPQAEGNTNNGDVMFSSGNAKITMYQMCIKKEYAKVIDNYFTMYGYKVNSLETLNIRKRPKFDYIKTIGCNIAGNIPQTDLNHIKTLFDNGIRIWHDTSHFLDYNVNNSSNVSYHFVNYIESSGTQYIDTGIFSKGSLKILTTIEYKQFISTYGYNFIFGGRNMMAVNANGLLVNNNTMRFRNDYYNWTLDLNPQYNNLFTKWNIVKNKGNLICTSTDGQIISAIGNNEETFTSNSTIYIFAMHDGTGTAIAYPGSFKLYSFTIYDNNTLVRDYKPCIRISDNKVGLYDSVTDTFYENKGTGNFTYG